jgi:hypothetical protein
LIYFMQPVDGGPVKIGCSGNVEARRGQLESYYKESLVVLATFPGDRKTERETHARFAHLRLGRTEQFRPAPELMEFIGLPPSADHGDVEAMAPPEDAPRNLILRCDPAYVDFLGELEREARERGHAARGRSAVAELACNLLGLQWGIKAPRRVRPMGANQHGEPANGE